MVESVSFRTRARTIDHLGREQIADCPTAISELWKNAYDAYASNVSLHIFDAISPVAAIMDDGHGMSKHDFVEKWLVVGTESKTANKVTEEIDRNGLRSRPKQGQKGIGRLSSAFLGPLLLVVSKRRDTQWTAALVDWRLFENPFLYLHDIEVPLVEFESKEEIFAQFPGMLERLRVNLVGKADDEGHQLRVQAAWSSFDKLERESNRPLTSAAIKKCIAEFVLEPRFLEQWDVWKGTRPTGTLLLVSDITFDLEAQLSTRIHPEDADAAKQSKDRLFQTLSNFTDPFINEEYEKNNPIEFSYSVIAWEKGIRTPIISGSREFDYRDLEDLEHVVEGEVDESGCFRGRVKAFGIWLDGVVTIPPKGQVSNRDNSKVGKFQIHLGTFQQDGSSSSHPPAIHKRLLEQAGKYAGLMVYRDSLRVMPYGREDNDFFEIEKRRTLHAGRYFWSNRRTFGRVSISRENNFNLKDKAGREGLIDNKAAKIFRDLVENILIKSAFDYFGSNSDLQAQYLPDIKELRAREKAEATRSKQRATKRKHFRTKLRRLGPELVTLFDDVDELESRISQSELSVEQDILEFRDELRGLKNQTKDFSLGEAPKNMSGMEDEYFEYRSRQKKISEAIQNIEQRLAFSLQAAVPKAPRDIAFSDLSSHAAYLQSRLRKWQKEARSLLESEERRIASIYEEQSKRYHSRTLALLDDVEFERVSLSIALKKLEDEREEADLENSDIFEPYIGALRSLNENIDLDALAAYSLDKVDELREEIERLHSLAQLGITVEIIGHEIEGLDLSIRSGLDELPRDVQKTEAFGTIRAAHDALSDRLHFLSPLKLSGPKFKTDLRGTDIIKYIRRFFGGHLEENGVVLSATSKFEEFSIYEQPSRIFPVFLNLINNALYWVRQVSGGTNEILLDARGNSVIISDSGPGVDENDQKHLFSLFFTRKIRGGRGVGLYLSRANLAAGGHTIRYANSDEIKDVLLGANFVIEFKGARNG
ncbi:ATP-binding protein [Janthinobacterium sp. LB3P112]|uniref:ATP-binding protein n=1 Tax=Janthinobacterium sp. LB3P112 TaxID=3424196 RepID=UPI003F23BA40